MATGLAFALVAALSWSTPLAEAAQVRRPPVGGGFDYQLGGAYSPAGDVTVLTRDRTDRPAPGVYSICYLNAFQTQPGALPWWRSHHPRLLLRSGGRLVRDPGWPGEVLLDTRTAATRRALLGVVGRWIDGCARSGFAAVESDNLDSFGRSRHRLTRADNLALAASLARRAHARGLAFAQKNLAELGRAQQTRVGFDFAVAEDCQVYDECGRYRAGYGDHVLEVEYSDRGRARFEAACRARGAQWSIVYRDRGLTTPDRAGYVRSSC